MTKLIILATITIAATIYCWHIVKKKDRGLTARDFKRMLGGD